ncbi:ribose-5-phosphate isomerase RpiA [Parvularcula marina]|uniref:Ribose-5-phosphate isomerase A n=1 Tax=Parvularcula marina TaxID=2292771 RepID=A0A371R871_9PROT|nr:ribose-5-phosphate isomerase RpiA [Parvularcula marina]RFB01630.1 ribose-5-phosphate isomerase RpiA [Parvularcula marina]
MSTSQKERAALAALELVRDGMTIGLGTGSTAAFFIEGLGRKIREEGLEIEAIPTSQASDALARKAGIELIIPDETTVIDLDVDGADEVSAEGHLIKGGGAALLREKIIARAAKQFVVIADESKSVTELGAFPLPIEIEQFGFALTVRALRDMLAGEGHEGVELSLRHNEEGSFVLSDGGNFIVDAKLGRIREPVALESALNMIPGVVDCGLFIGMADQVIIGTADGIDTRRY